MAQARKPVYKPDDREKAALTQVRNAIDEAKRWHTQFASRVERRYNAWRGMAPQNAPATWRSNMHPPYLINIVEGMLSQMEEQTPVWKVTPRALPGMTLEEAQASGANAETLGHVITHQMRIDDFTSKQRPFALQDLIAGFTVAKIHWLRQEVKHQFLDEQPAMIYDEFGGSIDMAMKLDTYETPLVLRDDPTFEVRDVRDFLFPESATSLETCPWVIDRTFVHYKTLERMQQLGVYKNVEFIKETRMDSTQQKADVIGDREQRLRSADRTRGLVKLIELWTPEGVICVANDSVVIRDAANPFFHGRFPFIISSAIPDLFQIPGVSVIEGLAQMQDMLWTLTNLRIDTTRMAANLITLIRGDVENADDFEWAPNAQWFVTHPDQVRTLDVNPAIANTTLQAEALLKGDIQNIMGGLPYSGGTDSSTVDQKTATGISIVTNIAQAVLQQRKGQYVRAFGKAGGMFASLNQQFLREERLIEIIGPGAARRYMSVAPANVKGIFDVEVEMTGDSMMRQERRAEDQALLTMANQGAAVAAQMGVHLNIKRFWEKLLESYDVVDKETFFTEPPAPQAPAEHPAHALPPGQGQGSVAGADTLLADMAPDSGGGATNASLAAGATSPSSDISLSGGAAMQRSLANVGAGRSV